MVNGFNSARCGRSLSILRIAIAIGMLGGMTIAGTGRAAILSDDFESYANGSQSLNPSIWANVSNGWVWDGVGNNTYVRAGYETTDFTAWFPIGQALFFQSGSGATGAQPNRFAETVSVNLTGGGRIAFNLSMGSQNPRFDGPFERQDSGEFVRLQFSLNNGITWGNLHGIVENQPNYTNANRWSLYTRDIPATSSAASPNVRFRITQNNHSGNEFDTWAIDNFRIVPEPSSLALLGMSSIALLFRRNRR